MLIGFTVSPTVPTVSVTGICATLFDPLTVMVAVYVPPARSAGFTDTEILPGVTLEVGESSNQEPPSSVTTAAETGVLSLVETASVCAAGTAEPGEKAKARLVGATVMVWLKLVPPPATVSSMAMVGFPPVGAGLMVSDTCAMYWPAGRACTKPGFRNRLRLAGVASPPLPEGGNTVSQPPEPWG